MARDAEDSSKPDPEGQFRHAQVALDSLRRPNAFDDIGGHVLDVEIVPTFDGGPDRMEGWLIFASRADAADAVARAPAFESRARSILLEAGFPAAAIPSFVLRFASLPEIEERGGRFAFFR